MSSVSAAGSSIAKAHGSGVRKGLGAVSKDAKKAANPSDAGGGAIKAHPNGRNVQANAMLRMQDAMRLIR